MDDLKSSERLKGKVALITGAGRGIGRAIAKRFALEGADLFLSATRMETLNETKAQCDAGETRIELHTGDVADRNNVEEMVSKAIESFGRIDILINNAGIYRPSPFVDYKYEDFDRIMKVNVYGVFNVTQFVLKHMLEMKRGKIINIASTAGKWASLNQSAYNMSKHAIVGMTRCVALETAQSGINVNAICPGLVDTDMVSDVAAGYGITPDQLTEMLKQRIPMGRLINPEEIPPLAVYLASADSDGMTGQSILLDGGMLFV